MDSVDVGLMAAIAACGSCLSRTRAGGIVAAGVATLALGVASAAVGPAPGGAPAAGPAAAIDGGLILAGVFAILVAALHGWRSGRRLSAAALAVLALALAVRERWLLAGATLAAVAAAAAVLGIGAVLSRALSGGRRPPRSGGPTEPPPAGWKILLAFAGLATAAAAPNIWLIIAGALVAGAVLAPVSAALAAAGLLPFLWFVHRVAGPVGLAVSALPAVPLSPAAESLAAPLLAAGALMLFGLWPMRRFGSPLLLIAGVAVLVRLGVAVPSGLIDWRTVLVPLGVVGLVHAAVAGDTGEAIAGWAWLGAVTGAATAPWLLAAAAVTGVMRRDWAAGITAAPKAGWAVSALLWAATAAGGALALASVLRAEVVYAVLATLLTVLLALHRPATEPA